MLHSNFVVVGMLSVMGLIFWMITKEGNIAIIFSIIADGFAAVPTLLTLPELTFANSGFILYILVLNTLIFSFVQFRPGKKLQSKTRP